MTGPDVARAATGCRGRHCRTATGHRARLRCQVTRRPAEWAFATHKPCPIIGRPSQTQAPTRSMTHPSPLGHGNPDHHHDTMPCQRCGASSYVPAEVRA
ncbi:hypothetical protein SNOUR_37480 [Streptomyces noursei ATCC 11455]|nr:hypothetical protein SNOUR_37480 [Streptomyces noursei ATCC 11455]